MLVNILIFNGTGSALDLRQRTTSILNVEVNTSNNERIQLASHVRFSLMHAACTLNVRRAELVTHVIEPVPENKNPEDQKKFITCSSHWQTISF